MNEKESAQRFIKDKYMLFISTRATLLQMYLSAYNNDVTSIKVTTLRSVQSRIAICTCLCYWRTKNPLISLRSPFKHSVLVRLKRAHTHRHIVHVCVHQE